MEAEAPDIIEVIKYGENQTHYYIRQQQKRFKNYIPEEHHEDICQDTMVRILSAFKKLDETKGWKAFVQKHAWGAVTDYINRGRGFEDNKWAKNSKSEEGQTLRFREYGIADESGDPVQIEDILANHYAEQQLDVELKEVSIRWELLAKLCSMFPDLHIFVRHHLLGHKLVDLTKHFNLTRERIGQRVAAFIETLDDPKYYHDKWVKQIIFALGLCEHYGMPDIDQGVGHFLEPVDLSRLDGKYDKEPQRQLSLF